MDPRRLLLEIYEAALREVDGQRCVVAALGSLDAPRISLFAIGKAAASMTRGAHEALGERIFETLLITKDGHADAGVSRLPDLTVIESAHPVPDERSLAAGAELERRILALREDDYPVFLVSGGSSSLVEALRADVTLEYLRALNQRGLAEGWDIGRLNAARAGLSRLKQGGVARLLGGRRAHALFISDVPRDDPDVIGSGLLGRAAHTEDRVLRLVLANIDMAVECAVLQAAAQGLTLEWRRDRFDGEAATVAREFVAALRATPHDGLAWGGESTVTLPARAGRGGRNQHLALLAATLLREDEDITILAAGTDGTDGASDDAGAIVDSGTVLRAELGGADVERALREFDSGIALEAAGDLLHTGPTGTNVGDILIGIKRGRRLRGPTAPRVL